MTSGIDWINGEWLVYVDPDGIERIFKCLDNSNETACWQLGKAGNKWKGTYRKATVEELIKHLSIKDKTEESISRFPFNLNFEDAQKILGVACAGWRQNLVGKWGESLILNGHVKVSEGFYKEMRKACTAEQNRLFDEIFGKDTLDPIYVTHDGVEIFETSEYSTLYGVATHACDRDMIKNGFDQGSGYEKPTLNRVWFKSREEALRYAYRNVEVFSIEDIIKFLKERGFKDMSTEDLNYLFANGPLRKRNIKVKTK
jgi:hypothetical protein